MRRLEGEGGEEVGGGGTCGASIQGAHVFKEH